VVDCDEVLTTELIESLHKWKQSEHHEQHPYSFKRVHFFKGKKMNFSGLQNDYVVRLLPKGMKYEELNVHEKVRSSSKRLKGQYASLHLQKTPSTGSRNSEPMPSGKLWTTKRK